MNRPERVKLYKYNILLDCGRQTYFECAYLRCSLYSSSKDLTITTTLIKEYILSGVICAHDFGGYVYDGHNNIPFAIEQNGEKLKLTARYGGTSAQSADIDVSNATLTYNVVELP